MRDGNRDRGLRVGFSPLAGVTAGTAAVLFAFGVLALAWHRVAAQVSAGITVLVYAVTGAVCAAVLAGACYAVLWLRHRALHPETLAPRQQVRAEVVEEPAPAIGGGAGTPRAIDPPRVYLNLTDEQLAALMRHHDGDAP